MDGEDLLRALYKLFYFRFCVSSDQWKNTVQQRFYKELEIHFCMKIIVTTFPTNLVTNCFYLFFALSKISKIRITFSAIWRSGNDKYLLLLFIASHPQLQRYSEFNRLLQNFLTCYSFSYYSFMVLLTKTHFQFFKELPLPSKMSV